MKKVLLMIAVIAVLALSACGNRKAPATEVPATDSTLVEVVDTVAVDTVAVQ